MASVRLVNLLPMPQFFAGLLSDVAVGQRSPSACSARWRCSRPSTRRAARRRSIRSRRCARRRAADAAAKSSLLAWDALGRNRRRAARSHARHRVGHRRGSRADGLRQRVPRRRWCGPSTRSARAPWSPGPGQTSEQAGGERAGKKIRFEKEDFEVVRAEATLVKDISLETVQWRQRQLRRPLVNTAIRGVYPEYGTIRNEVAAEGRWISAEDFVERRRVAFLGGTACSRSSSRAGPPWARPCSSRRALHWSSGPWSASSR